MFELSPRVVAGVTQPACDGGSHASQNPSPKRVARREPARVVLGTGTRVPSHRADLDELRVSRSAATRAGGKLGKSLASPRAKSSRAEIGLGCDGITDRLA